MTTWYTDYKNRRNQEGSKYYIHLLGCLPESHPIISLVALYQTFSLLIAGSLTTLCSRALLFPLIQSPSLTQFHFDSDQALQLLSRFLTLLISRRSRAFRLALAEHLCSPFEASGEGSPTSGPQLQLEGSTACHSVKLKLREEPFSLMAQDLKEASQDLVITRVVLDGLQKNEESVEIVLTNVCSWLCRVQVSVISYTVVLPFCKKDILFDTFLLYWAQHNQK